MIPAITTAALFLLACALVPAAFWLIDIEHGRRVVFTGELTEPVDGICPCGAPKCTPQPAPFPGDEPVYLPAPAADGPGPDDSTLWNLHKIEREYAAALGTEAVGSDG